jgi:hypothetical protein
MVMLTFWRALKDGEASEALNDGGAATASEAKEGEAADEMDHPDVQVNLCGCGCGCGCGCAFVCGCVCVCVCV